MVVKSKTLHQTVQEKVPTKTILGVPIAALRLKEISSVIVRLIEEGGKKTFFYVDVHHFNIANKDLTIREFIIWNW